MERASLSPVPHGAKSTELVGQTSEELFDQLRSGEPKALDLLLSTYWCPLVKYAVGVLGYQDAAEDVVQEAFIRLWTDRERWERGSLAALLYRITRNLALDMRRKNGVRTAWLRQQRPHHAPSAAEVAREHQVATAAQQAIDALPPRRREVFLLARREGLSYREIAEVLEISPQTVANQMSTALADLRRKLAGVLG